MNDLPIKLTVQASILDKIVLKEPIDTEILDKLINSNLLLTSSIQNDIYENEKQQLLKYATIIKHGHASVKYIKSKGNAYGRVNPKNALGLFAFRRSIRHTLAKTKMVDIDMQNAHPVILLNICKKNNIQCAILNDYVKNRDQHLEQIKKSYSVTRDTAKTLFIQLMYFGKYTSWASENNITKKPLKFIDQFSEELQKIGNEIIKHNSEIQKIVEKKKTHNQTGSIVSYFLQEYENRILESIFKYCISNKIINDNIAVLCADGLMIEKKYYNDDLINIFENLVKDKFNITMKFTIKNMDEDYLNILDDNQIIQQDIDTSNIDFEIKKMTDYFFDDIQEHGEDAYMIDEVFKTTKSFRYFNFYHSHFYLSNKVYKHSGSIMNSYSDFGKTFAHLGFDIGKRRVSFEQIYLRSKHKSTYSTFDFEPNRVEYNDTCNLFRGFKYETDDKPDEDEAVQIYIDHIKFLCNGNNDFAEYVLNWFAHIIQYPERKTKVALVFYSIIEGVGKNIAFDIFDALMHGYNNKFKDTNDITTRFNGDMMGKLFVVGDEINGRASEVMNELKDLITREKETVEFKGKDKIYVNDFKNYAFTTNNENIFRISNSDRRFALNECSGEPKKKAYYQKLGDILKSSKKLQAIQYYLKNRDISKYNPTNIVVTEYKQRLIIANIPAYLKFAVEDLHMICNCSLRISELYKLSVEFAKRNKLTSTYTERLFTMQFAKIFDKYAKLENKTNRRLYRFPDDADEIQNEINKNYIIK